MADVQCALPAGPGLVAQCPEAGGVGAPPGGLAAGRFDEPSASRSQRRTEDSAQEWPAANRHRRHRHRSHSLSSAMTLFCVADILLYSPWLWVMVLAERGIVDDTKVSSCIVTVLALSQAIVLTRSVSILAVLRRVRCARALWFVAVDIRGLCGYVLVMLQLMVVFGLTSRARHEHEVPTSRAIVPAAAMGYNFGMLMCHALWMHHRFHRLRALSPSSTRLLNAAAKKRFAELDEETPGRNTQCSICLDDFDQQSLVMILPCGHIFHVRCGREWLKRGNVCPFRCSPPDPEAPAP
mmetsp:Transcript_191/g.530  ORF Transcript_191/g.530 Transcript_191/m.530 type:complete len:295 (+) Transcript_191:144-1028(+)